MNTLDKIEPFMAEAEAATEANGNPAPALGKIRDLLAEAALAGEDLDKERLESLVRRCAQNYEGRDPRFLIHWGNIMGAFADYHREGVVGMRDGRVATADGWDYDNCQPDDLHCNISRFQSERLQAYISTLTDAEASHNPERDPSEYDEKFDEAVELAITEYLNKKGFPQLWQR
jgi:hypothetical protein